MFTALLVLFALIVSAGASPLQPAFSSCLSSYPPVAAGSSRLNVTSIYANLASSSDASRLGLVSNGDRVLRIDVIGVTGEEVEGYNNDTNKLGEERRFAEVFTR